MRSLGIIPARLNSTRLPRKVLRELCGKPMLQHVYERAKEALTDVVVAVDAPETMEVCQQRGIPAVMTGNCSCGTERIWEAVCERPGYDVYVNVQCDEPTMPPSYLRTLIAVFDDWHVRVATLKAPGNRGVNVVCDCRGDALFFSRSPIPSSGPRFQHIGVYAYRYAALRQYHEWPPTPLQICEDLEQLRFLENGQAIRVIEVPRPTISVDTEEDLAAAALELSNG